MNKIDEEEANTNFELEVIKHAESMGNYVEIMEEEKNVY